MDIGTILTSLSTGFIAAGITGYSSRRNSERAIQIENVTQERTKWRDKIRKLALKAHRATVKQDSARLAEVRQQFSLNLNPHDPEDTAIIGELERLPKPEHVDEWLQELSERIALLLKHDWERGKYEASLSLDCDPGPRPKRVSYREFKEKKPIDTRV
jgi:hypothetical protein